MKSDIQIARETPLKKITEVASSIGISSDDLHTYGHYMAKGQRRRRHHLQHVRDRGDDRQGGQDPEPLTPRRAQGKRG